MKQLLLNLLILVAGLLLVMAPVLGQSEMLVRDRLMGELDRTDDILTRAREVVIATNSPQAKVIYDKAVTLQAQALEQFQLGPAGGHWNFSSKLTLQARLRAQEAIAAGRDSQQNETALLRRLERAQDLLDQARGAFGQADHSSLESLYLSAERNLERAWEFFRQQHFRAALKLTNQVERTAEKMLQTLNREVQRDLNYERQVENARQYLDHVRDQIIGCESPSALQLIDQAEQSLRQALQYESEGNREASLRALQQSREAGTQATRECRGENNLLRRYERLLNQAERIGEEADAKDHGVRVLLGQAHTQLDLAHGYLEQNQVQAAIAALKAAQLSLDEAQRRIQDSTR